MENRLQNALTELPTCTKNVVEIIERRVKASARFHFSPIHTWNQPGTALMSLDTIDGEIAIYIIARVVERSLHSGILMFQGMEYGYLHSQAMTARIERSLLTTYGHMAFFSQDIPRLVEQMFLRFLKHHHLIVRGNRRTLKIPTGTHIDRRHRAHTTTTLH